jgi:serine/threonine protein kinase
MVSEAARIVYEICLAVEYLHSRDIAHRDLKVCVFVALTQVYATVYE